MMNTVYENEIIENKMTELLNSKIDTKALMTLDDSLSENAGLRKVINRYTYSGKMEKLGKGEKNSVKGTVSFVPEYYDVKRYQQTFGYNDMDAMADPYIVDVAMQGAVTEISNQINEEFMRELSKISTAYNYEGDSITYADLVDALSAIDCEVDSGLFIIMGGMARKEIRKDPDFVSSKQGEIIYSGQFGTICGIPVIFSKLIQGTRIIVTNKNAVRFFVKKSANVEQARDIETKDNTVVYERHGLIALVDDTNSVVIGKAPAKLGWTYTENVSAGNLGIVNAAPVENHSYFYMINYEGNVFLGDILYDWNEVNVSTALIPNVKNGDVVTVAEVDENGKVLSVNTYTCKDVEG